MSYIDDVTEEMGNIGHNPNPIGLGPAVDVAGWDDVGLDGYPGLMEADRKETKEEYNPVCAQSNSLMAVATMALSIIVNVILMGDLFRNAMIFVSLILMGMSIAISGYTSAKSVGMVTTHPNGHPSFVSATDPREMKIASINTMSRSEDSDRKETDCKRRYLGWSSFFFLAGIALMILGMTFSFFTRSVQARRPVQHQRSGFMVFRSSRMEVVGGGYGRISLR